MGRLAFSEEQQERGRALVDVLKSERERQGWTSEGLASETDIHVDTLRNFERYKTFNPGLFTVIALADALGMGLDDLRRRVDLRAVQRKRRRRGVKR